MPLQVSGGDETCGRRACCDTIRSHDNAFRHGSSCRGTREYSNDIIVDERLAMTLPRAVLVDLDDTLLDTSATVDSAWDDACTRCELGEYHPSVVAAIKSFRDWFWSDPERHRVGRLDMTAARRHIVSTALKNIGYRDAGVAKRIADLYSELRDQSVTVLPGALDTLQWFRASGCLTALLTNGASAAQREKITRFGLDAFFDCILVEGDLGFGKPDLRVFKHALAVLNVNPEQAWMIGDNLVWDIAPARALGIYAVWIDAGGRGLPESSSCVPDRIVRRVEELRDRV
jgi:putative hydrolase of the HAD superfamily